MIILFLVRAAFNFDLKSEINPLKFIYFFCLFFCVMSLKKHIKNKTCVVNKMRVIKGKWVSIIVQILQMSIRLCRRIFIIIFLKLSKFFTTWMLEKHIQCICDFYFQIKFVWMLRSSLEHEIFSTNDPIVHLTVKIKKDGRVHFYSTSLSKTSCNGTLPLLHCKHVLITLLYF